MPEQLEAELVSAPGPEERSRVWEGGWPQNPADFARFVDVFQNRLVRHAFRKLGNPADAEEVCQEVFLRAFADRLRLRRVKNVSAYLYRMVSNRCLDQQRTRQRRTVTLDIPEIRELSSDRPDPSEETAAREELHRIDRHLSSLPPKQAEILRLHFVDDLPMADIAHLLRRPLATVKSRFRYGMEKLRNLLAHEAGDPQ